MPRLRVLVFVWQDMPGWRLDGFVYPWAVPAIASNKPLTESRGLCEME